MIRATYVANSRGDLFQHHLQDTLREIQEQKKVILSVQLRPAGNAPAALIVHADKDDEEAVNAYVGE